MPIPILPIVRLGTLGGSTLVYPGDERYGTATAVFNLLWVDNDTSEISLQELADELTPRSP